MNPSQRSIDSLLEEATVLTLLTKPSSAETHEAERMRMSQTLASRAQNASAQQRIMMQWLLHFNGNSPHLSKEEAAALQQYVISETYAPTVRLAAAHMLHDANILPEEMESTILTLAQSHNSDCIVGAQLVTLVWWAICTFSHDEDELIQTLLNATFGHPDQFMILGYAAINNMSGPAILDFLKEMMEIDGNIKINARIFANFAARGVRKLLQSYDHEMDDAMIIASAQQTKETTEDDEDVPAQELPQDERLECADILIKQVLDVPHVPMQHFAVLWHVAEHAFKNCNDAKALYSIEKAEQILNEQRGKQDPQKIAALEKSAIELKEKILEALEDADEE
jgi:hypothetical protein